MHERMQNPLTISSQRETVSAFIPCFAANDGKTNDTIQRGQFDAGGEGCAFLSAKHDVRHSSLEIDSPCIHTRRSNREIIHAVAIHFAFCDVATNTVELTNLSKNISDESRPTVANGDRLPGV